MFQHFIKIAENRIIRAKEGLRSENRLYLGGKLSVSSTDFKSANVTRARPINLTQRHIYKAIQYNYHNTHNIEVSIQGIIIEATKRYQLLPRQLVFTVFLLWCKPEARRLFLLRCRLAEACFEARRHRRRNKGRIPCITARVLLVFVKMALWLCVRNKSHPLKLFFTE